MWRLIPAPAIRAITPLCASPIRLTFPACGSKAKPGDFGNFLTFLPLGSGQNGPKTA